MSKAKQLLTEGRFMTMPKTGPAHVERLIASVKQLGVKAQLQLIDSIKHDLIVDGPHGIRYSTHSLSEYKRSTKDKAWDAPLAEWVHSFDAGDVFFDIGANTGAFSLLAGAQHGADVQVVAFEPGFENFEALVRNILANDLSGVVTPLPVALSDSTNLELFNYRSLGAGSALHALGSALDGWRKPFEPAATQQLLAFRLDDLTRLFDLPRPTRIKIDVDGAEARVIAGAAKTLSAGACELWVEITEATGIHGAPATVADELGRLGFTLTRRLDHEASTQLPRVHDALFVRH